MISITSKTGSSDGVIIEELKDSEFKRLTPRVTKSRTLDGGVVYDHRGMITADREFNIRAVNLSEAQVNAIQTIIENETYINLACDEGFFEGVISSIDGLDVGRLDMIFWVYVPIAEASGDVKRMYVSENLTITEDITVSL